MLEVGGSLVWFLFPCVPASDYSEVEVEGGKAGWLYFSGGNPIGCPGGPWASMQVGKGRTSLHIKSP